MAIPASAIAAKKIGAKDLGKVKVVNNAVPLDQGGVSGAQANCPKGARVISGGVFFTPGIDQAPVATDLTRVRVSVPTTDGKAWYGAGENQAGGPRTMYVTAHCLLKSKKNSKKIGANDLAKYDVEQNSIGISPNETKGEEAACDEGRVMAGGSFLDTGEGKPDAFSNFVLSQMTTDGNADYHFAAGRSLVSGPPTAVVIRALCLPDTPRRSDKIGSDDLKEFDLELESFQLLNNQIGGGYSLCKDGERVISGGSFLQTPAGMEVPNDGAAISGTSAAGGGNAWYGATRNLSGNTRNLVVLALCLPQ